MRISRLMWGIFLFVAILGGEDVLAFHKPLDKSGSEKKSVWIDSRNFSKFSTAVKTAVNRTLIISNPVVLDTDVIIPSNTHLLFLNGGSLTNSQGKKIIINGPITAPIAQIFIGFRPGDVTFGDGYIKEVYPQWWGAKVNDKIDDSLPLQCAIESGAKQIYLPSGYYLLNRPLNITNRPQGLIIQGAGMAECGGGTILIGNTGGIVIDTTGSRYLNFRDFKIISGQSNPSTIGIFYARSNKIRFVEFNSLTNVGVNLSSVPEANNGNGTVAIYNYAAELWRARNVYLQADNAVVFTGYNIFNLSSPFAHIFSGYPSMSECTIDGASTLRGRKGPCVTIDNGTRIEILNAYLCGGHSKNCFPYAISITGRSFWAHAITITGNIERGGGGILYTKAHIVGLTLNVNNGATTPAIFIDGGSIRNGQISIQHGNGGLPKERELFAPSSKGSIINTTLDLFPGQHISSPNLLFISNIIKAPFPLNEAKKSINVSSGSSYFLITKDGIWSEGGKEKP